MIFAFFALSTLFVNHAHAQEKPALMQDESSAPARCGDNQLSLQNLGEVISMGAMRYSEFIFTNTSSVPCTLKGYPRFEFVNKYGRPVRGGMAANGDGFAGLYSVPPQLVTLEPGKKAKFVVHYNARYDEDREKPCAAYRRAKINVPGMKRVFVQRFQRYGIEVCSGLEVSPLFAASKYDY
jgi:hypothetical protein